MSDEPKRELLPGEAEADAWIDTLERRADAMSDERRDQIIQLIGYSFGALVSGNYQPHMSGDPRARIHSSRRRHFDDACADCADAILTIFKPSEG